MPENLPPLVELADPSRAGDPTTQQLAAASTAIRAICGWHVAPNLEQTVTLDAHGGKTLVLPSLHVTNVTSVKDLSGDTPVEVTGYRWSLDGMLYRAAGWPDGFRAVEVTMVHGFESNPEDIGALVQAMATHKVSRESIGGRSIEIDSLERTLLEQALTAYRIMPAP